MNVARSSQDDPMRCVRCDVALEALGTKRFHEGALWGVLGDLGELLVNREIFDMYFCPRCGRIAAFVHDVGTEFREDPGD